MRVRLVGRVLVQGAWVDRDWVGCRRARWRSQHGEVRQMQLRTHQPQEDQQPWRAHGPAMTVGSGVGVGSRGGGSKAAWIGLVLTLGGALLLGMVVLVVLVVVVVVMMMMCWWWWWRN